MASFCFAARYHVTATLETPLRVGPDDGNSEEILRDGANRPCVPGTSIAGALLDYLNHSSDQGYAKSLFGAKRDSGQLIISDGVFDRAVSPVTRPRLHFDASSGSAHRGGKFDSAHLCAGETFVFTLTHLAQKRDDDAYAVIERLLGAVDRGEICFGGWKTNGFGRVSLAVTRRILDLRDETDRDDWMNDQLTGETIALPNGHEETRVIFRVSGCFEDLLVKGNTVHETAVSYAPSMTEGGRVLLPGSTVKGALRARVCTILESLNLASEILDDLFGMQSKAGRLPKMGRVVCEDTFLEETKKRKVSRIRINRFTGGVMRMGSVHEPASGKGTLKIALIKGDDRDCALLLFALRDLGLGLYGLGSDQSVGRGLLRTAEIQMHAPQGVLTLRFDERHAMTIDDPEELLSRCLKALEREGDA